MDSITGSILVGLIIAIVSSVISSLLTFHLAKRRYRNEKWWEFKAKSYQEIIKALSDSVRSLNAVINREQKFLKTDHAYMEQQVEINNVSQTKIRQVADVGSFLISEESEERLIKYEKKCADASKDKPDSEFLECVRQESLACLNDLKILAKKDLNK